MVYENKTILVSLWDGFFGTLPSQIVVKEKQNVKLGLPPSITLVTKPLSISAIGKPCVVGKANPLICNLTSYKKIIWCFLAGKWPLRCCEGWAGEEGDTNRSQGELLKNWWRKEGALEEFVHYHPTPQSYLIIFLLLTGISNRDGGGGGGEGGPQQFPPRKRSIPYGV